MGNSRGIPCDPVRNDAWSEACKSACVLVIEIVTVRERVINRAMQADGVRSEGRSFTRFAPSRSGATCYRANDEAERNHRHAHGRMWKGDASPPSPELSV